nr:hypothetical protein [Pseudomonas arsenicoxydans]
MIDVVIGDPLVEFRPGQGDVTQLRHLLLDGRDSLLAPGFEQDIRHREAGRGNVFDGSPVGGVKRRHAGQTADQDLGNADDRAAMIVEFKRGAYHGVAQFRKFGVVNHDECVFGVDILDRTLLKRRAAKQARIVQPDHTDSLVSAIGKSNLRAAYENRHGVFNLLHAAHRIEQVVRQRNNHGGRIHRRVDDPHRRPDIGHCRVSPVEDPGKHCGHLHHQEHRKSDAHQ